MVKKMGPRLRELAAIARGSHNVGSRNLGPSSFIIPVLVHVFLEERVLARHVGEGPQPRVEYGVVAVEQGG